mmetsp:Transcript_6760/g.18125  ORF Transcript_6760/g.18125 Transcript_6760/m.18125 type:complete len:210 (+) Transcript_6760:1109-1738(+)
MSGKHGTQQLRARWLRHALHCCSGKCQCNAPQVCQPDTAAECPSAKAHTAHTPSCHIPHTADAASTPHTAGAESTPCLHPRMHAPLPPALHMLNPAPPALHIPCCMLRAHLLVPLKCHPSPPKKTAARVWLQHACCTCHTAVLCIGAQAHPPLNQCLTVLSRSLAQPCSSPGLSSVVTCPRQPVLLHACTPTPVPLALGAQPSPESSIL